MYYLNMVQKARVYVVRGRVQGVGYRNFAQLAATGLRLKGYAKNLDDGSVEVYAIGPEPALNELSGVLAKGPRWGEVRGVDQCEAAVDARYVSFRIER